MPFQSNLHLLAIVRRIALSIRTHIEPSLPKVTFVHVFDHRCYNELGSKNVPRQEMYMMQATALSPLCLLHLPC